MNIKSTLIIANAPAEPILVEPLSVQKHAVGLGKYFGPPGIRPGVDVGDRKGMRKYIKNATPAVQTLQPIIDNFIKEIQNAPKMFSYNDIYTHYLSKWFEACAKLKARKLKAVIIDSHYFAEQYAPRV